MATVIDSLVVTLGLDAGGMKKGADEGNKALKATEQQATKTSRTVEHGAKDMAVAFNKVKIEIMGMLAALGVAVSMKGIEGFFVGMTKTNAALGRFATNVGMSASRLDAMRTVAEQFGDTAETAYNAVQTVANGISEATYKGQSAFTNIARANGIQLQNAKGQWLSYEDVLVSVSKRLQSVAAHNGAQGRQLAFNLAGRLGLGSFFNELMDPNYAQRVDAAQRLSGVTEESTKNAQKLQAQWALIREQFRAIKNQIYTAFAPTLLKLGQDLAAWLKTIDWNKLANDARHFIEGIDWKGFSTWIKNIPWSKIKDDIVQLVKAVGDFIEKLDKELKPVLMVIGGLIALKMLTPLGSLITLLTGGGGLLSAIGLVSAAFAGWKLGSWINDNLSQENQDKVGRFVAMILAATGDKTAQAALDAELAAKAAPVTQGLPTGDVSAPSAGNNYAMPAINRATAAKIDEMAKAGAFGKLSFSELNLNRGALGGTGINVGDNFNPRRVHGGMLNHEYFAALEKQYGLPPGWLQSQFMRESAGGTMLRSKAGALGPMQFMPGTAAQYGMHGGEVYDLAISSKAAARMAQDLYRKYGNWDEVRAAYNFGQGNLDKLIARNKKAGLPWYAGLPAETRNYVNAWRRDAQLGSLGAPQLAAAGAGTALGSAHMEFSGYGSSVARSPVSAAPVSAAAAGAGGGTPGPTYYIESVAINTRATDARGIMQSMSNNLANNRAVSSVNTVTE